MNSRERYLGMLQGAVVDVVPRVPILMRYAAEHIGSNYGAFAADYRVRVEANRRCAHDFGLDLVGTMSDPYCETHGFGGQVTYVADGVPRCTQPLEEDRDLEKLPRPDPHRDARMADRLDALRAYRETCGDDYAVLGWVEGPAAEAATLRGVTNFLFDLVDEPAYAGALMDRCVETAVAFAAAQVDAGADTIGIGDAIASQVSPRLYERLILPREKRLVDAIRGMGAYVRLHICGNITHLLPGIAGLDVDVLDLDHPVDLRHARAVVGRRVVLTGNLDPVAAVLQSTPDAIRAHVRACYRAAGNPYLVNAGCEIPSGTPPENLKALCEPVPYEAGW